LSELLKCKAVLLPWPLPIHRPLWHESDVLDHRHVRPGQCDVDLLRLESDVLGLDSVGSRRDIEAVVSARVGCQRRYSASIGLPKQRNEGGAEVGLPLQRYLATDVC